MGSDPFFNVTAGNRHDTNPTGIAGALY
jgi:hypothetical protein